MPACFQTPHAVARNKGAVRLSLSKQDLVSLQRAGDIFDQKIYARLTQNGNQTCLENP